MVSALEQCTLLNVFQLKVAEQDSVILIQQQYIVLVKIWYDIGRNSCGKSGYQLGRLPCPCTAVAVIQDGTH